MPCCRPPDDTPEDELGARDLQSTRTARGIERISHQEMFDRLVDLAEGIILTDIKYASDVVDAAVNYVCYKEPEKCSIVRYVR